MRPPEELHTVDWSTLNHAYGAADDVPELIRALYSADGQQIDEALYELYGNVHHQGTVYPATVPAVPFLAHAALHIVAKRAELLMLLVTMADQPVPADTLGESVRAAVGATVTDLLSCLADPDQTVRRAAVRLAALATDPAPESVVRRLAAVYDSDPVSEIRGDALTALTRIGGDQEEARSREIAALERGTPDVRLAAALLGLERSAPPYPADLVEIVATDGAYPDPGGDDFPFAGLGTREYRLTELLTTDVHAGLTVAACWVEEGDLGSRGSWLAEKVAETWRDREAEVVAVLTAALPHQRDPNALRLRLEAIARWIPGVHEPDAGLRDVLLEHAASADSTVAQAAQLALARCGDATLLTGRFELPAQVLTALAAADDAVPHIRQALRTADTHSAIDLVRSLDSRTTRQLLPELKELLRTRRAAIPAARLLGTLDGAAAGDPEVLGLLASAMESSDEMLRAAAAASHALLTGDTGPALAVLNRLLTTGRQVAWYLPEAGRLGAAGAPLLPMIEERLSSSEAWSRMAAAETHWRITGDPERAVPILTELAGASPVGLSAVKALAAIGTTPEELRPVLRHLAWSPVRLMPVGWPPEIPHPDEQLRATALHLLR